MELYQLSAFQTVARTANLTKAAEAMHVSQSALSTQIRNLEDELGVSLFMRQAKGMQLTSEGETLLPLAQELLSKSEELRRLALNFQQSASGPLNIGLNTDPTFLQLNRVIRTITTALPQVSLSFSISQTLTTEAQLLRGEMDMGFVFGTDFSPAITVRQLATTPISVVVPTHLAADLSTLDWPTLAAMPWIWTTCRCPFHVLCQRKMDEFEVSPNTVTEAVDENIVKELALGGMGVALMRKGEALDVVRQGVGVIWDKGELQVPLCLTWLSKRDGERVIVEAVELIENVWQEQE